MLHLDPERLAALADGEPTAEEAMHLAACGQCTRERAAFAALVSTAALERSTVLAEPLTDWQGLSAQLAREGLVRGGSGRGAVGERWRQPWLKVAAAVLLALGGGVVGRATAGYPIPGSRGATGEASAREISSAGGADTARQMVSLEDALELMRRAESEYRLAAAYIAAHDTAAAAEDGVDRYRARLAALDRVSDAALAAVNEAPADPIINQYLISARAARAVTLQQLNSSLPAGTRLASY
jgi:hypothetical protein